MAGPGGSRIDFDVLKTRNTKPKSNTTAKTVPHFDGLRNPFYNNYNMKQKAMEAKNVTDNVMNGGLGTEKVESVNLKKEKVETDKVKTGKVDTVKEKNTILGMLKEAKCKLGDKSAKAGTKSKEIDAKKAPPDEPFKTPRKKSCLKEDCNFCGAQKCGMCPNCLDKGRRNKCIRQICPRLNKKHQNNSDIIQPNVSEESELVVQNPMWTDLINDENLQDMQNLQRIDPKYMQVENSKEQLVSTDVDHTGESSDADITTASQPNSEKTKKQTDFCVKCGKTLAYLGQLSRHIQAGCMKSKEIRIKCPSCNQGTRKSCASHADPSVNFLSLRTLP